VKPWYLTPLEDGKGIVPSVLAMSRKLYIESPKALVLSLVMLAYATNES